MVIDSQFKKAEFHWLQEPERTLSIEADDVETCECCGEHFFLNEGEMARLPEYQLEGPTVTRNGWVCYECLENETGEFEKCAECGEYFHTDFIDEISGMCRNCLDR